jgi:hypothetical protein
MGAGAYMRYTVGVTLLPLLLLLATPAAPVAVPRADATLSADSEQRWIAFDLTPGNQIRFAMTLDGRPVTAILDTGVSYSVVSRAFATAHGFAIRQQGRATVIGGSVEVGRVATDTLEMGGLTRRGGTFAVADLPAAATGSETAVDLLVGRDLTAGFALDIDYQARRFRFLKSGRVPFAGLSAPLTIAADRMVYVSSVSLRGTRLQPVIVDTGDGSAVTLSRSAWASVGAAAGTTTSTVSFGLAGPVVSDLAVVPTLSVGRVVARHVEVRIEPPGGFSDTIGVAGRIGSGFLQRYRVLLDPGAGHMLLAAGATANREPMRSTSGLLLGLASDRLKVLHVMRGSPAASLGWRDGEAICTVDGVAVGGDYASSPIAHWTTGDPGRVVRLGLCDGANRTLTLRHFY